MGKIGENPREIELEPMPEHAPVTEPAVEPAQPEPIPA